MFRSISAMLLVVLPYSTAHVGAFQRPGHSIHDRAQTRSDSGFGDPYMLPTDPVSGEQLASVKHPIVMEHEGRELRFAREENVRRFRADPARYLAEVDAALIRQELPFYPLKSCPVSGETLGEMAPPVDFIYRNRLVRFCCKGCQPKFQKDPARYLAELDAAVIAAQKPDYPLGTCVVSGEELDGEMGEAIDHVVGNRLVRLCCRSCKKKVARDPLRYLAVLDRSTAGGKGHAGKAQGDGHDHGGHDHGGR